MRIDPRCLIALAVCVLVGCIPAPYRPGSPETARLKQRALASLKQGVRYPHVPVIRCQAVEALRLAAPREGLPWIRNALEDENPGVRFAACLALGELRDATAKTRLAELANDSDASVRAGAIFALHRAGESSRTHELADLLIYHRDAQVRRNAALVLGRLGEPAAVKLLARVMNDPDEGLRLQALESMALLGAPEACEQLRFLAHSGLGSREAFAVGALGATRDPQFMELYQHKMKTAAHRETRLAAARALGQLRLRDGYALAIACIGFNSPDRAPEIVKDDPPESQIVRVRTMATLALGAIADCAALPALGRVLDNPYDPRVELAAATAILEILRTDAEHVLTRAE